MELEAFKYLKEAVLTICPSSAKITGNVALTAVLYGFEHLMEKINSCPCDPVRNGTYAMNAFGIPATILFMASLVVVPDSRKLLKCATCHNLIRGETSDNPRSETSKTYRDDENCCTKDSFENCCTRDWYRACCTCRQCRLILATWIKVSIPSLIWVVILLLDGDYYTCYWLPSNNQTAGSTGCKDFCNITASFEERQLCSRYQWIGAIVLVVTVSLLVVSYFLPAWKPTDCTEEIYYERKFRKKLEKKKLTKIKEELEKKVTECADVESGNLLGKLSLGKTEQGKGQSNQSTDKHDDDDHPDPDMGEPPRKPTGDNTPMSSVSPSLQQPGSVHESTTTQPRQHLHHEVETGASDSSHKRPTQSYIEKFGIHLPQPDKRKATSQSTRSEEL
ncbi:uncharacterized protein LOC127586122 [Pristis pectinata]|uniref:uncharacterized protein LOC127586122 n=1 Tax=Pristis pectinata TaxID=685728 RepID=UPI00223DBF94|nr:uncharacterized protein LOC127586122 [Pristis pectinata]